MFYEKTLFQAVTLGSKNAINIRKFESCRLLDRYSLQHFFFFYFLASTTAPESALKWSLPETWQDVGEGWGGHNHTIPGSGDDVLILPSE